VSGASLLRECPFVALVRHSKIADGLPLSLQEGLAAEITAMTVFAHSGRCRPNHEMDGGPLF
jgi:hypothetical protein